MAAALLAWPPPPQHPMLLPWHRPRLLPGVHVPQGPCPPAGTHRVGGAHRVWAQSWRGGHAGRVCVELCTLMVCVLRGLHAHGCVGAHRGVQGRVCALTGCGCSRGGGGGRCRGVCALTGCGCSCDVHRGSCKLAGCALALHTHGGAGAHRVICALTGFAHWLPGADARCHPSCQVKIQVPSWILGGGQGASLGFHCCPTGHASAKENTQGGAGGWQPLRCQP